MKGNCVTLKGLEIVIGLGQDVFYFHFMSSTTYLKNKFSLKNLADHISFANNKNPLFFFV